MPTISRSVVSAASRSRRQHLTRIDGPPPLLTILGQDQGFYARKQFRSCDFAPFYGQRGLCSVCGSADLGKGHADFCSTECEQLFTTNHNWELAKPAAMHRDGYTCTRCGHEPDPQDPQARASELVVRHIERPQSPQYAQKYGMPTFANTRRSGCHQHLENLITLCRFCDDADTTADPDLFAGSTDVDELETSEAEATVVSAPAIVGPTTSIADHELDPGLCRQRQVNPDIFFEQRLRSQAVRLCAQCPVRMLCAQRALDLRDTDGIIAGVFLPGKRFPDKLADRREQLQQIVDAAKRAVAVCEVDATATVKTPESVDVVAAPVLQLMIPGTEDYVELERASA